VLTHADLAGVLAGLDRPLLMIDIAVPRDIDPRLGAVPNVVLRNIDDLRSLVADGLQRRRREIPRARAIVAEEVARFSEWAAATEEQ
jgi:glutamyl-tRNA reductase